MTIKELKDMIQGYSLQAILVGCVIAWGPIMFLMWLLASAKTKKRLRKDLVKVIDACLQRKKPDD